MFSIPTQPFLTSPNTDLSYPSRRGLSTPRTLPSQPFASSAANPHLSDPAPRYSLSFATAAVRVRRTHLNPFPLRRGRSFALAPPPIVAPRIHCCRSCPLATFPLHPPPAQPFHRASFPRTRIPRQCGHSIRHEPISIPLVPPACLCRLSSPVLANPVDTHPMQPIQSSTQPVLPRRLVPFAALPVLRARPYLRSCPFLSSPEPAQSYAAVPVLSYPFTPARFHCSRPIHDPMRSWRIRSGHLPPFPCKHPHPTLDHSRPARLLSAAAIQKTTPPIQCRTVQ